MARPAGAPLAAAAAGRSGGSTEKLQFAAASAWKAGASAASNTRAPLGGREGAGERGDVRANSTAGGASLTNAS